MRVTSQLINSISRGLQNLLKCFNGTVISTSFVLLLFGGSPAIFILGLNDLESVKLSFGSSLYNCHRLPDVLK